MKKILTLALVGAMLTATGITAFAETTNVSYDVQPTYTVTIPATVDLGDNDVTANIDASDVLLETGKQIKVELTSASNTTSGSTFNAKNGDSAVTYTISAGDKAIAVNDTVATFTANGSKTLTFSAADKSAATVAGAHTETLTFGISVEDAATVPVTVNTSLGIGTSSSQSIQFKKITVYYTENGSTEEKSESFTTTGATSFTGEKFKITAASGYVDDDGVAMEQDKPINIESLNGENITKVDLTVGYYGGRSSYIRTTPSTTISGNDSVGGTITLKL